MVLMVRRSAGLWMCGAVVALAVLTLAVGFCLVDSHDHGMAPDLCFALLMATLAIPVIAVLPRLGWTAGYRLAPVPVACLHTPAPPPKSRSLR